MGKIQVFTSNKDAEDAIVGTVVVDQVAGSPEEVFASKENLFALREEVLLREHLSTSGSGLVDFCIRIDGGDATDPPCHVN